jgi:hypothetical protein
MATKSKIDCSNPKGGVEKTMCNRERQKKQESGDYRYTHSGDQTKKPAASTQGGPSDKRDSTTRTYGVVGSATENYRKAVEELEGKKKDK